MEDAKRFVISGIAASVSVTVTNPLDVLKGIFCCYHFNKYYHTYY